ncbi:MAG TPA: hypothetical protein VI612_04415 [Candidatus Nanoarchaeia archaeon]|nr:hypothetical protein [Candidatus Nanoarchaeia archaeon]
MDNQTLVERLYRLQGEIRSVNSAVVGQITKAIIPLLEYKGRLEHASERDLLEILGITRNNVAYFIRIFKGEEVEAVARDVPKKTSERKPAITGRRAPVENTEWNGGWDNAVSAYER